MQGSALLVRRFWASLREDGFTPPIPTAGPCGPALVNASLHRRTYRQEPGHKGGAGGALKEALHRRPEDAPGGRRTCVPAELSGVEGGLFSAPIAPAMNSSSSPISPLYV